MSEKTAENETEVDELSIIRQLRTKVDKLPDARSRLRALDYVRDQVMREWDKEQLAHKLAEEAKWRASRDAAETMPVPNLRTASGHYV